MQRPIIGFNSTAFKLDTAPDIRRYAIQDAYVESIFDAGGEPLLFTPVKNGTHIPYNLLKLCQAFVFIGGPDYPSEWYGETPHEKTMVIDSGRAQFDFNLAKLMISTSKIPLLGICGGEQLLNIAHGGRLIQHIPYTERHTGESHHDVTVTNESVLLARIVGKKARFQVNSKHHQAVHPNGIGNGLMVAANADDGTIEGIEGISATRFVLGLQWHPELLYNNPQSRAIFSSLIEAAKTTATT